MKEIFSSHIKYPNASWPILLLRIAGGGLMLLHGIPKLQKLFAGAPIKFADPFGLGPAFTLSLTVFAEVLCAVFILVGFKTRAASIPLAFTMFVAAFVIHWPDPLKKKELALMYFLVYVALFFVGSGKFSIDNAISKK